MKELLLFVVGLIVGGMNAIAGGGMLLGYPIMLAVGMNPLVANVTANLVILPGQLTSAIGYRRYLKKTPRRYLVLLIPCIIGAAVGAIVLRHTSNDQFARLIPGLILFAVLLFAFQPYLHIHLHRHISRRSRNLQTLWLIALALLPVAVYAGFFGPGFGFIMLAFLSFTSLRDVHQMNALKNIAGVSIATVDILILYSTHLFNWPLGLSMAAGSAIGGYSGARFSQRFSSYAIRLVVIAIGVGAALYLGFRDY
ncbi:MAG TPA: sulfite exporter TauE/SafE family protein [Candidatus Saccharimonadales bacterium]|nr:sulfite exporter TauE/SafE family protein [Candidatus Saccharimonadales bacterium]